MDDQAPPFRYDVRLANQIAALAGPLGTRGHVPLAEPGR